MCNEMILRKIQKAIELSERAGIELKVEGKVGL